MSGAECAGMRPAGSLNKSPVLAKATHDEYELQLIEKDPVYSITVLLVLVFGRLAFYECVAYERIDGGMGGCCEFRCVGGKGPGPEDSSA